MDALPPNPPTVADVREFRAMGPWRSKSGGSLNVLVALSHPEAMQFFDYDPAELGRIGVDIRGLRIFVVNNAPVGGIAGNQFHRVRREIEFVISGKVRWAFEDLYGGKREISVTPDTLVHIPPFVLHAVTFEDAASAVVTLANTVYLRDDPRTYDTYPADVFRDMQDRIRGGARAL